MKNILVAIDLEGGAEQVLAKAASLVKGQDVNVIIMNVMFFPVPTYPGYYGEGLYSAEQFDLDTDALRRELTPEIVAMANAAGLPDSRVIVDFGRPTDAILDVAEQENVDLIVLGSHGRHGIKMLLGSTANGILHHSKCDVLAVRIQPE
jgi:universal stress protein A